MIVTEAGDFQHFKERKSFMDLEKFEEVDLTKQLWDAIEMQYGDYIRFIKEDFNRQIREA